MGLFNKIFGSKEPAPIVQIHPDDKNLVKNEDMIWWKNLSLDDCKKLEKEDNLFRTVAIRDFMENHGLSEKEAVELVKKKFLFYYLNISERDQGESYGFSGENAKLPYPVKYRANNAVWSVIKKMNKQEIDAASSMNALIRKLMTSRLV